MALNPDALEQVGRKRASRYDVHNKLALPVGLMGYVWPVNGVQDQERVRAFWVVDIWGQSWVLEGHLRPSGHPKPEVSGPGWRSFKETKGLRVGDELIFYRPPAPNGPAGPVFVIGVKREIRLGGATFSGHVSL